MNDKNESQPAVRKILGHETTVLVKVKDQGEKALPLSLETLKEECALPLLNYAAEHNLLDKEGWKSLDRGLAASRAAFDSPPAFPKILDRITNVVVQVEREDGTETKVRLEKLIGECPLLVLDYAEKHNLLGEDVWKLLNDLKAAAKENSAEKENLPGKNNRKLPNEGAALKPRAAEANAEARRPITSVRSNARKEPKKVHPIKKEAEDEADGYRNEVQNEQPRSVPTSETLQEQNKEDDERLIAELEDTKAALKDKEEENAALATQVKETKAALKEKEEQNADIITHLEKAETTIWEKDEEIAKLKNGSIYWYSLEDFGDFDYSDFTTQQKDEEIANPEKKLADSENRNDKLKKELANPRTKDYKFLQKAKVALEQKNNGIANLKMELADSQAKNAKLESQLKNLDEHVVSDASGDEALGQNVAEPDATVDPSLKAPTSSEEANSGEETHRVTETTDEANARAVTTDVATENIASPNQARGKDHVVVEAPNQARDGGSGDMQVSTEAIQGNGSMGGQVQNYHGPYHNHSTNNTYYKGDSNVEMKLDKLYEGVEGNGKVLKEIREGIEKAREENNEGHTETHQQLLNGLNEIQNGINKLLNERGTDREEN